MTAFREEIRLRNSNIIRELYRGYLPLVTRQCVAWVIFLIADSKMKSVLRDYLNLPQTETIPKQYLLPGSAAVAIFSTLGIMPFDSMKTHMQRENLKSLSIKDAVNTVVQESGVRGLFVGWRIRFAMYQIHALMTTDLLDRLEVKFKRIEKKGD